MPECTESTRYALRAGADFVMICASGGIVSERDSPCDVQFHLDEIRAIVDTAAQAGKHVVAHTLNAQGARNFVMAGVKSVVHSFDVDDEVIELGKERGTVFTSTLGIAKKMESMESGGSVASWVAKKAAGHFESAVDTYPRMHNAGAVLAVGTILCGAQELELLVRYCGFSPVDAIVAATRYGAMACFIGEDTGTLEVGTPHGRAGQRVCDGLGVGHQANGTSACQVGVGIPGDVQRTTMSSDPRGNHWFAWRCACISGLLTTPRISGSTHRPAPYSKNRINYSERSSRYRSSSGKMFSKDSLRSVSLC